MSERSEPRIAAMPEQSDQRAAMLAQKQVGEREPAILQKATIEHMEPTLTAAQ